MGNWVEDQFLQRPVPDPWVSWTLDELRSASQELSNPPETRERMRVVIKARQQGMTVRARAALGKEAGHADKA